MPPSEPTSEYYKFIKYNPVRFGRFISTLPLWRRIFARFSDKYKVSKKEYDEWFNKDFFIS